MRKPHHIKGFFGRCEFCEMSGEVLNGRTSVSFDFEGERQKLGVTVKVCEKCVELHWPKTTWSRYESK